MPEIRFDAAAVADITLARDWYDHECAGLGEEFVDSVEAAVSRIGLFPGCGFSVDLRLRRQFLDRFPYVLYYQADGDGVLVVACLHMARGPEYRIRRVHG